MAGLIRVYIGKGSAIRTNISSSFDTKLYPSASGFHVRFDSNSPTGIGYEFFFVYGGGLWFKTEQGGGWKEVAIK